MVTKAICGFKINYDTNKLELTKGEAIKATDWNAGNATGTIALMVDEVSNEGVYRVTFKVKENAEYGNTRIETTDLNIILEDETEINNVKAGVDISIQEDQGQNAESNQTQNETTNKTQNENEKQNQLQNENQNQTQNEAQNQAQNEIPQNSTAKPSSNTIPAQNNDTKNEIKASNIVKRDASTATKGMPYTGVQYVALIVAGVIGIVAVIIRIIIKYYDNI